MFFDKGKISITIQRTNYTPGDMISGDVALTVKKPVQAKEVSVSLIGEQKITRMQHVSGSQGMQQTTEIVRIYEFKQQLDGEKEYSQGGQYHFEMKIPADILNGRGQMPGSAGGLGQGFNIIQGLASMAGVIPAQQTRWYLQAKLDIPGSLDVNKSADITIG